MPSVETVTILITDLVGSTGLESRVGPVVADELRREHFGVLREAIAEGDGEEVKNTGDGLMVAFSGASAAIDCAVRCSSVMERRNRGAEEQLPIKVGLGMGEATHEGDDYFGMPSIDGGAAVRQGERRPDPRAGAGQADGRAAQRARIRPRRRARAEGDSRSPSRASRSSGSRWAPRRRTCRSRRASSASPPLGYVGRAAELELLSKMWDAAASGERRVGLVSGEPGIGKTRLVTHTAIERHGDGAVVLYGRCEEDLATPYGPWIEALDHYAEHAPEEVLQAHVERHGGELTRLLPELGRRIPDAPAPKETDPETERYLLFGAALGLLDAGERGPSR